MDVLPTSSSVTKTPAVFSTSASASFHSRLTVSSSSSQRRLRALSARSDSDEPYDGEESKSPAPQRSNSNSVTSSPTLPVHVCNKPSLPQKPSLLYCGLIAYCFLSVAFFTYHLFDIFWDRAEALQHQPLHMSPIGDISRSHLLTKLLPTRLHPVSFHAGAFAALSDTEYPEMDVTICSWAELSELTRLEESLSFWDGPMSIVILTDSASDQKHRVSKVLKRTPNIRKRAVVHVMQHPPHQGRSPNVYLNLARMFARTRHIVLFPTYALVNRTNNIHDKITDLLRSMNNSQLAKPHLLVTTVSNSRVPRTFPPFSPLLIEREYPIWCTERFFTASRDADWQECLWQFWLYSYGTLSTLKTSWEVQVNQPKKHSTTVDDLVHRRLSNRFKHETCMLAANNLKEKSPNPNKVDPQKAQWLRKICKEAVSWDEESL